MGQCLIKEVPNITVIVAWGSIQQCIVRHIWSVVMWYSSRERVFIVQIFLKDPVYTEPTDISFTRMECVMCICFFLFSSIVSDSGSDNVLLGPVRNVLCQIWELNDILWLSCDDDKSLCGKTDEIHLLSVYNTLCSNGKKCYGEVLQNSVSCFILPVYKTSYSNFKIIYSVDFESVFSFNIPTKCTYNKWY